MGEKKILCSYDCMEAAEFTLKKGDFIPPHNHPGTTVFCYVVKGKMRVKSYDLLEEKDDCYHIRLAGDTIVITGDHLSLTPQNNNIHSIEILEDTVFIDAFTPPYVSCTDIDFFSLSQSSFSDEVFIAKVIAMKDAAIPYGY